MNSPFSVKIDEFRSKAYIATGEPEMRWIVIPSSSLTVSKTEMVELNITPYATPSTDAALSNVPGDKAGAASGIYKMASSLGAALGVAISAALFTALSGLESQSGSLSDLFLGRTDNINIRFAAAVALLFNVLMVVVAIIAIAQTVPRD